MTDGPPFHQTGDPDGHFFALAFVRGRYVSPSGSTNSPASLVLYFSNSADFAPFVLMTVSGEGAVLSGHPFEHFLRTVEYALLRAADADRVPVAAWTLYPRTSVEDHAFPDAPTREAYWESRRRLCMMLYPARVVTLVASQLGKIEPLFRHDGTTHHTDDGSPDNEEIWETVVELTPDRDGEDGQE